MPPIPRPLFLAGLAQSWRGYRTLQLGADPSRAVLVDLPHPRAISLFTELDGSRSLRAILQKAADHSLGPDDAYALIETLREAGCVVAAPTIRPPAARCTGEAVALALHSPAAPATPTERSPARILRGRAASRVVISGRGRLGIPIAVALAESGVGHVHPDLTGAVTAYDLPGSGLPPTEAGSPRAAAATEAVLRAAPGTDVRTIRTRADLTIQLGHDQPVALLAAAHLAHRRPHLPVTLCEGVAAVGPLVPATGKPCLNCVDLCRRTLDPGWTGYLPAQAEPATVTTILAATAFATAEALSYLDGGRPETLGATVEITATGRFRRRTWRPDPRCPCAQARPNRPDFPHVKGA